MSSLSRITEAANTVFDKAARGQIVRLEWGPGNVLIGAIFRKSEKQGKTVLTFRWEETRSGGNLRPEQVQEYDAETFSQRVATCPVNDELDLTMMTLGNSKTQRGQIFYELSFGIPAEDSAAQILEQTQLAQQQTQQQKSTQQQQPQKDAAASVAVDDQKQQQKQQQQQQQQEEAKKDKRQFSARYEQVMEVANSKTAMLQQALNEGVLLAGSKTASLDNLHNLQRHPGYEGAMALLRIPASKGTVEASRDVIEERRLHFHKNLAAGRSEFNDMHLLGQLSRKQSLSEYEGRFLGTTRTGHGTFGSVYAALDTVTNMPVALKLIRNPEGFATTRSSCISPVVVRELALARLAASPLVAPVLDVLLLHDGQVIIVMPLIEHDLRDLLRRNVFRSVPATLGGGLLPSPSQQMQQMQMQMQRSPLPRLDLVRTVMGQLLEALDELHRVRGVEHRDIKTNNVMIRGDGVLQLCDFGWARTMRVEGQDAAKLQQRYHDAAAADDGISSNRQTPRPCAKGCRPLELLLDPHAPYVGWQLDMYGAGCVMWELLSGGAPLFRGETEDEVIMSVVAMLGQPNGEVVNRWRERGVRGNLDAFLLDNDDVKELHRGALPAAFVGLGLPLHKKDSSDAEGKRLTPECQENKDALDVLRALVNMAAWKRPTAAAMLHGFRFFDNKKYTRVRDALVDPSVQKPAGLPEHVKALARSLPASWSFVDLSRKGGAEKK